MRKCAILFALLPSVAIAETSIDQYRGSVDEIVLSDIVEVPLYTAISGAVIPCVKVTIGDQEYLFGLNSTSTIYLGESLVKEQGLEAKSANKKTVNLKGKDNKWKTAGGEVSWTTVETMKLGGLELHGVSASTTLTEEMQSKNADHFAASLYAGAPALDGWIGLGAIPELAWAIKPSQGVVQFAPADRGKELVAGLQGEVFKYREQDSSIAKYGKTDYYIPANRLIAPVNIGGKLVEAQLYVGSWGNSVRTGVELPAGASRSAGDQADTWQLVQIGGLPAQGMWLARDGGLQLEHGETLDYLDSPDAYIGMEYLSQLDIAVDPVAGAVALRAAPQQRREDPSAFLLADATKAAEKKPDPPAEGEEAPPPSDDPNGSPEAWKRLGDLRWAKGDFEGALLAYKTRLEFDGEERTCSNWVTLGQLQMDMGDSAEAINSYAKASELFHAWWDLPLAEREQILEDQAELSPEELKESPHKKQPGSCHHADGYLASAYLTRGALTRVEELYREKLNLSPHLAKALGSAALLQGNLALAQEAYRQAIVLESAPDEDARLGLALVYDNAGDAETAESFYRKALEVAPYDETNAVLWVDATSRNKSPQVAVRGAQRLLENNPDSEGAYIAAARALRVFGQDEAALAAIGRQGEAFFARQALLYPNSARVTAANALFLVELGRLDEAKAMADRALTLDPSSTLAHIALGNVHVLQGDVAKGQEMFQRAGQLAPLDPALALLLDAQIATAAQ